MLSKLFAVSAIGILLFPARTNAETAIPLLSNSLYVDNGTTAIRLGAPAGLSAYYEFIFPTGVGMDGQVLTTNADGTTSWTTTDSNLITASNEIIVGNASNQADVVNTSSKGKILASSTDGLTLKSGAINDPAMFTSSALADASNAGIVNPYGATGVVYAGVYTPSISASNYTSVTARQHNYSRVGKIVTVTGSVTGTVTTTATDVSISVSLPVATGNFSNVANASGSGTLYRSSGNRDASIVWATTSAQTVQVQAENTSVGSGQAAEFWYTFSYEIQ